MPLNHFSLNLLIPRTHLSYDMDCVLFGLTVNIMMIFGFRLPGKIIWENITYPIGFPNGMYRDIKCIQMLLKQLFIDLCDITF